MADLEVRFLLSRGSGYKQADPHRAIRLLNQIDPQIRNSASTRTTDKKFATSMIPIEFRFQNP
jgi:hypothetical protein